MPKKIRELKALVSKPMSCHYSMVIQWSEVDQVFVTVLPEFDNCKTHGNTYEEAAGNGRQVLELLIESSLAEGDELPSVKLFNSQMRSP